MYLGLVTLKTPMTRNKFHLPVLYKPNIVPPLLNKSCLSKKWSTNVSKERQEFKKCQETVEVSVIKARIEINGLQHSFSSRQRAGVGRQIRSAPGLVKNDHCLERSIASDCPPVVRQENHNATMDKGSD